MYTEIELFESLDLTRLDFCLWGRMKSEVYKEMLICEKNCSFTNLPLRTVRPIYRTGVPLPSKCSILYIFLSTNIGTEYFKHAAHSPFFSLKCRLFHNATFLFHALFTFYVEDVLKFKCKTPVPKG
jgi:hypothetical protein